MGEWVIGAFINLFCSIAINFGTNLLKLGHDECVFAAIMLILVVGSLLGRMNIKAWMLFVRIRLVRLACGGYVIHLSSVVAGITAAYWVSCGVFVLSSPQSNCNKIAQ